LAGPSGGKDGAPSGSNEAAQTRLSSPIGLSKIASERESVKSTGMGVRSAAWTDNSAAGWCCRRTGRV